jgi:hypothetical protein
LSERRGLRAGVRHAARVLNPDQRLAAVGAIGLVAGMFLPWWRDPFPPELSYWAVNRFTFIELALVLVAGSILVMLYGRAEGRGFHLPLSDATLTAGAGIWSCVLVLVRIADPPSRGGVDYGLRWGFLVALLSGVVLAYAGVRGRRRHHRGQDEAVAADQDATEATLRMG